MFRSDKKKKNILLFDFLSRKFHFLRLPVLYKGILLFVTCLIIAMLISPILPSTIPDYQLGDISVQNIKATRDLEVEDTVSTEKKRTENEEKSPSVYDFDAGAPEEVKTRLRSTFDQ